MTATGPSGRLRVALDATPLLGHRTGVGVFCLELLRALSARGDVDVSAFAVSWRRRGGIAQVVPPAVRVAQRAMPARPLQGAWARLDHPAVEWFVGPVDVVHGTNFVVPPTRRAAAVVSVHDLTPLHHPELCNPATLAYPGLIRRALNRGAWVHTDSAFVAHEVVEAFGVDPDTVRVVHPGIAPPPPPAGLSGVAALLPPGVQRYVLSVGTAEPRKDLPGLVRAFDALAARHRDLGLVLAGPPGWGEAALGAAVERAGARARIVRTGWLEERTVAALVARAAVLAFPSRYEGFGFPPLEAMAAGTPVVATRAGSLPEVLGHAALLVEVGDHDALAAAIERVLDDPALSATLVAAGRRQAAAFRWDRCADGLVQLYHDVAGRARG